MRIQFQCEDGSMAMCQNAPLALLHWHGRQYPITPPEDPSVPSIQKTVIPTAPGNPNFLPLVIANIERQWQKAPDVDLVPPTDEAYQETCLTILRWLHEHGDITSLKVDSD